MGCGMTVVGGFFIAGMHGWVDLFFDTNRKICIILIIAFSIALLASIFFIL